MLILQKQAKIMEKEIQEVQIGDMIKPTLNRICIELISESDTYFGNVKKLDSKKVSEPYSLVISVGTNVESVKPGDYVLTRATLSPLSFNLFKKDLSIINEHDIEAVISKEVVEEIRKSLDKGKIIEKKIELIN